MRSAESVIGVSGFLISCATRRATSLQAAIFCARSRSLVSSMTITKPDPRPSFNRRNGDGQMQGLARRLHFQLLGGVAGAAGAVHQIADLGRVLAREQIFEPDGACAGCESGKDLRERLVDELDARRWNPPKSRPWECFRGSLR